MSPKELAATAEARYGEHWVSLLAKDMGLSVPAILRWKKEGIASNGRAGQVRRVLETGKALARAKVDLPTPDDFKEWRQARFESLLAASRVLGLNVDTIRSLEAGETRKGNPVKVAPWLAYAMIGYDNAPEKPKWVGNRRIDVEEARRMIEQGASQSDVALHFRITRAAIRQYQKRNLLPQTKSQRKQKRFVDLDKARQLIETGMSTEKVAMELGVTWNSIYHRQQKGQLPNPRNRPFGGFVFTDPANLAKATEMILEGRLVTEIAERFGVSRARIYQLQAAGKLPRKPKRKKAS